MIPPEKEPHLSEEEINQYSKELDELFQLLVPLIDHIPLASENKGDNK